MGEVHSLLCRHGQPARPPCPACVADAHLFGLLDCERTASLVWLKSRILALGNMTEHPGGFTGQEQRAIWLGWLESVLAMARLFEMSEKDIGDGIKLALEGSAGLVAASLGANENGGAG